MSNAISKAKKAKQASIILASAKTKIKNRALENIAIAIRKNRNNIIKENKKDIIEAKKSNLNESLIKRLILNNKKINEIISMLRDVIKLEDPVGKITEKIELDNNLILSKITVPIGLIGAIFESRPDATVQISSLCIKSGNAVILKGGSEASNTNNILVKIIRVALKKAGISEESVQLIETREQVKELLKLHNLIDLLIPRGSNKFVKYIQENTKILVLGHSEGICHVYIDKDADIKKALSICYDSKCQYAAVCNAMETLLVHKSVANKFLPLMVKKFKKANVELRGDKDTLKITNIKKAEDKDWSTEYNDLILSIKIVKNVDEAIQHINQYGSKHTDAIVTENQKTAEKFIGLVDSSSVMHNCSTRFSDGFRYGKGAEVGVSTAKIHARGPVGLEGLVIYKYVLVGKGHIVKDYADKKKKFIHKRIK